MRMIVASALAGVSMFAMGAPAYAQNTGDEAEAGVADNIIIVQARRRDESIQDVPAVVQAVSGDQLQQLELRQFEDVSALVPGLDLQSTLGGVATKATLRGVDFDARASGAYTTVEFYRNDAAIPGSGLFQSLYDIGQIEVLRGPQGTLKGRAAPSGSITVHTQKPKLDEAGGYLSGTLAEGDRFNVNGAINVPIVRDKLAVRVAGFVGESNGSHVTGLNLFTGETDKNIYDEIQAIRASVRADPFDGVLVLDFNYEGIDRKGRFFPQVESFNQVVSGEAASPVTIRSKDYLGVGALANTSDANVDIYNWQAQLNLFGQSLIYLGQDYKNTTNTFTAQDFAGVLTDPFIRGGAYANNTRSLSEAKVHEVRLQNDDRLFGMFDYVIGYLNLKQNSPTILPSFLLGGVPSGTPPFLNLIGPAPINSIELERFRTAKEESFFGNLTLHLGESTEVSGGIRKIRIQQNSGLNTPGGPLAAAADCRGISSIAGCGPASKDTIYSASIKHDFNDNITAYASYGTSFRPGNVVIATAFQGIGSFLNNFIRPVDEKSKSFEGGIKTSWLNDTLRFNITAYHQKFTNFAFRPGTPVLALGNVFATADEASVTTFDGLVVPADAKIDGVEAELAYNPSDNFLLSGVLSYTNGKIKNATFPCVDLNDDNIPDTTAPTPAELFNEVGANQVDTCLGNTSPGAAPKWAGTLLAEYSHEVSVGAEGFIRGLASYKGKNAGIGLNPLDTVKAYTLFDLFAGVRAPDGSWSLTAYAKNLFDTHRVLTRTDAPLSTAFRFTGPSNATRYLGVTTTLPREFGVTLNLAIGSR
ncbi:MAG: TonB-dependent receptor [Sphingomonadaceae bacterium]